MTATPRERRRQRARRLPRSVIWLAAVAAGALLFAVGVAVGEGIHDNPKPGITTTHERTVTP